MPKLARLISALALLLPSMASPQQAYTLVAGSADPEISMLWRIDLATGDAEPIGPVGFAPERIAFGPGGRLFAADAAAGLLTIDPSSMATVAVGAFGEPLGVPFAGVAGLAFDPIGDRLWMSARAGVLPVMPHFVSGLFAVDPGSAALTEVSSQLGADVWGTLASHGERLFGWRWLDRQLSEIDPLTGTQTPIGDLTALVDVVVGMDFDAGGQLWMLGSSFFPGVPEQCPSVNAYRVSTLTGTLELQSTFDAPLCGALGLAVRRAAEPEGCDPGGETLCLHDGRFRVRVEWTDFEGQAGAGNTVAGVSSPDSGLFWFFAASNWEMLVKVLDGCGINDRYWVFLAATTNVGFTVTVTDTREAEVRVYTNPLGQSADAVTDTGAFATCP